MTTIVPSTSTARIRPHDVGLGVIDGNALSVDGCGVPELVEQYGTPLWIVSAKTIRHNTRAIRDAFSRTGTPTRIVYASKANPAPAVLGLVTAEGAMVDVASMGHATLATSAEIHPDRVVVNGNCKTDEYLRWAIGAGVAAINVDSLAELERIMALRRPDDPETRIALRVATDLDRHADDGGMLSSEMETKFGMSAGETLAAVRSIQPAAGLELIGLHHHLGFTAFDLDYTADLDLRRRRRVVEQLAALAIAINKETGAVLPVFNLGGGFRVETDMGYGPHKVTSLPSIEDSVHATVAYLARLLGKAGLPVPEVWVEPGGFIASNAAIFVARVGMRKKVTLGEHEREWAFLEDTSAYHFVRRLMADVHHPVLAADRMADECSTVLHVAGSTCAPDQVSDATPLPALRRGDLVALLDQGAYCESASTEYCAFPLPPTVLVEGGVSALVRRRRTVHDLAMEYVTR
jgi:diaminopimelate decarboxylase